MDWLVPLFMTLASMFFVLWKRERGRRIEVEDCNADYLAEIKTLKIITKIENLNADAANIGGGSISQTEFNDRVEQANLNTGDGTMNSGDGEMNTGN